MQTNVIYQEDCIEGMKKLPDNSVDLIITDPPYMISQAGKKISRKSLSAKSWKRDMDIKLDFGKWDNFESEADFFKFTESWFSECARVLKPKGWIYIFFDKQKIGYFDLFLSKKYGIKGRTVFAWLKSNPVPSFRKVNWLSASEFIWVGSKGECKLKNFLQQKEMFNYMITPNKSSYGKTKHPTEKPELVIEKFVKTNSVEGDIVLDPFMGSGTLAVVCKRLNRNYIGFEVNKEYYDIAIERLSQGTVSDFTQNASHFGSAPQNSFNKDLTATQQVASPKSASQTSLNPNILNEIKESVCKMFKLFCDLCGKEIINQDYVEQSIFNHFDFEQSIEGIFCKKCWEEQSPTSQTKSQSDFPNGEHNISLKTTPSAPSKLPTATSLNNHIKQNKIGG